MPVTTDYMQLFFSAQVENASSVSRCSAKSVRAAPGGLRHHNGNTRRASRRENALSKNS